MSNNDDPIKEYTPFRLGLDNLEDNLETITEYKDKDLHDCSNDLSERGSRREEIEHAKFAEKSRKENNSYNGINTNSTNIWNTPNRQNTYTKKGKSNSVVSIFIFLILFMMMFGDIVFEIIEGIAEMNTIMQENYETDNNYQPEYSYSDTNYDLKYKDAEFNTYKQNIIIKEHLSKYSNNIVLELNNNNNRSISNARLTTIFYDKNNNIIDEVDTYIGMLIGNGTQFLPIFETPSNYHRVEHKFINDGMMQLYEFDSSDIKINVDSNRYESVLNIQNNTGNNINDAQIGIVCMYDDGKIELETYEFYNMENGDISSQLIYSNYLESENNITGKIVLNDICIY